MSRESRLTFITTTQKWVLGVRPRSGERGYDARQSLPSFRIRPVVVKMPRGAVVSLLRILPMIRYDLRTMAT
jgi:hypothetical protein